MIKKVLKSKDLSKSMDLSEKVRSTATTSKVDLIPDEGGVINKKVLDAKGRANTIIDDAEKESRKIKENAESILSQVHTEMEKAREKGYAEGKEEGAAAFVEQVVAFEKMKEEFYEKAEQNIIRLVMDISEKVIGRIVNESGEAIKAVVRQALDSAIGDRLQIAVNPEDYKIIKQAENEFRDSLDRTKRLVIKEDENIERGGCIVETEVGTIDARLETQLKAIRKALEL